MKKIVAKQKIAGTLLMIAAFVELYFTKNVFLTLSSAIPAGLLMVYETEFLPEDPEEDEED